MFSTVVDKLGGNCCLQAYVFTIPWTSCLLSEKAYLTSIEGDYFSHFEIFPVDRNCFPNIWLEILRLSDY